MKGAWLRFSDAFLKFFGLRPYHAGPRTVDPYNIYAYADEDEDKRALRVAMFVTLLFHVLLFVIRFASGQHVFIPDNKQIITLRNIIGPPSIAGGLSQPVRPSRSTVTWTGRTSSPSSWKRRSGESKTRGCRIRWFRPGVPRAMPGN